MSKVSLIFLLVLSFLLGSCSLFDNKPLTDEQIAEIRANERELVATTISDQERQQAFMELLTARDQLVDRQNAALERHAKSLRDLNADYQASRDQYAAVFAGFNQERKVIQREYVLVIAGMKELTTAEEWRPIARYQVKYLDARKLTFERNTGG